MGFRTPFEDFLRVTLEAVSGFWQKLLYVSTLRTQSSASHYSHWGLARRYGRRNSSHAIRTAHSEVFINVLRSPTRELVEDAKVAASPRELSPKAYAQELWENREHMIPEDLQGGTRRHFELVLKSLRALLREQDEAHPDGSPPPPPAQ